ncbi:MAG: sensor histidine kinase [Planctomycetaceae bacterium]
MSDAVVERRADGGAGPPALSRAACVVLVRTVLGADGAAAGGLAAEFRRHGGDDRAVVAWLEAIDRMAEGPEAARDEVAGQLAAGFVVAGMPPAAAVPEAAALAAAVTAAVAGREARGRFDAAVSTARLEAMREFAYGAGHELNNPLANIAARAQALLVEEQSPERRRRLAVIVDQAFRGRDMIGGLMVFARPPKPAPVATAIDAMLAGAVEAVKPLAAARGARLECSPPPRPVAVLVDAAHVGEALRLLMVNALEAVAAGGRVTLAADRRDDHDAPPQCEVVVADDGPGMAADTLRRAFDPFFSGREAGRGIGLGLPKAWRLIEANGGRITVDSGPGRGTRVSLLLPLAGDAR